MKLTQDQKSNIRHFIYYLVNGTLDYKLLNTALAGKYFTILRGRPDIFLNAVVFLLIRMAMQKHGRWEQ